MNLAATCVKRPVFAVMLIGFLVVLGLFSFRDLGVDLFPKADPATVNINARLPGASSEEVTTQVVIPIEEALSTISGLDEITVMTFESTARITVRFVLERDIESAAQDVREKVSGAMRNLPPTLLPLVIQKADPDSDPVLSIVVAGGTSLRETTEIADKRVKRVLETVDGVGEVSLIGSRERQIRIFVDADKLNAHGITIDDFQRAMQNENVEVPGGTDRSRRVGARRAHARTHRRREPVRRDHRVERQRHADPRHATWAAWRTRSPSRAPGTCSTTRRPSRSKSGASPGTNTVKIIEDGQAGARAAASGTAARDRAAHHPGPVRLHQRLRSTALQEHLLFGSLLASLIVLLFIRNVPLGPHRRARDPDVDHRHLHADEGDRTSR